MLRVVAMMASVVILCIAVMLLVPTADAPEKIVERVWEIFDEHYALFEVKGVDWQALHDEYGPRITSDSDEEELYEVLVGMLSQLDDDQVILRATSLDRDVSAGDLGDRVADLGLEGARASFGEPTLAPSAFRGPPLLAGDGRIQYGWLDDRVGYLHLGVVTDADLAAAAVDTILAELADARAWVVDVRGGSGGDNQAVKAVADRFADRRRLFMVSRHRIGPDHDDLGDPSYWHVDPGEGAVTRPVALLTDRFTLGAAEKLVLAMRTLPHVTVVGDTTAGSMADLQWFDLHNGWRVSLSRTLVVDYADRCWEGIGVPPDVVVASASSEDSGDPTLASALRLLHGDGPPLQDESASAAAARHDLVEILAQLLEDGQFPAVRRQFDRIRADANPETVRVDRDEINALGYRMLRADRLDDAVGVFELYVELMPDDANAYDSLGEAFMERGDTELAIANYERSLELDPDNRNAERMLRRMR